MKYLLTLFGDESRCGEATPEQQAESMKAWDDFTARPRSTPACSSAARGCSRAPPPPRCGSRGERRPGA